MLKKLLLISLFSISLFGFSEINYAKVKQMLKQDDTYLIDIRTEYEWTEIGMVIDSTPITFYFEDENTGERTMNTAFIKELAAHGIDEESHLMIICSNGNRSVTAIEFLDDYGFENLYNITKGINYLKRTEGLKLIKYKKNKDW